jgi:hypothetical protein
VQATLTEPPTLAPAHGTGMRRWESQEAHVAGRVGFALAVQQWHAGLLGPVAERAAHARSVLDGVAGWQVREPVSEPTGITTLVGGDAFATRAGLLEDGFLTSAIGTSRSDDLDAPVLRVSTAAGSRRPSWTRSPRPCSPYEVGSGPVTDLQHSPLHDRHVALGAKLADFGGWEMPIEYPGGGVLKEHAAVREAVGSSTSATSARASCEHAAGDSAGPGRRRLRQRPAHQRPAPGRHGQAQYTLCCDDASGGVVDDLIAYVRSESEVFLIPNAANSSSVVGRLAADATPGIEVEDLHRTLAVLAVQGPRSRELVEAMGLPTDHDYMSFAGADWHGQAGGRLPHRLHR